MNIFIIIKALKDFLKNSRKVATLIRKAISLNLGLDKYFDQIDSIRPELIISLIGLTTEKNSSSRNAS